MANRRMEVEGVGGKDKKEPKYPFYRNKASGGIYPAMTSPSGYEDKNPEDWEPASPEEIAIEQQKLADIREAKKAELRAQSEQAESSPKPPKPAKPAKAEAPAPSAEAAAAAAKGTPAAGALPPAGGPVLPAGNLEA